MKKIYLLSAIVGVTSVAVAQTPVGVENMNQKSQVLVPASHIESSDAAPLLQTKAPGDIIWEDNFDDATLWDGETTANPAPSDSVVTGWSIGDTVTGAFSGGADDMGTTVPFARFSNQAEASGTFSMTYTQGIDLSAVPAPHLEFEQYGAIFLEKQQVRISTDGGNTWVTVGDNSDKEPLTLSGGSSYPQPETRRFNMTSALGTGPLNDVRIQLFWDGAMNGGTMSYYSYGWFVDNIRIVEGYENDMTINKPEHLNGNALIPYYFTPAPQVSDMVFIAKGTNNGGLDQTNVTLDVELNDGTNTNTVSSTGVTVAPGDTDSLSTAPFTPVATPGTVYNATYTLNQNETEGLPSDNSATDEFYITDTVYGVDNGNQTGGFGNFGSNAGNGIAIGNQMEVIADGQISSISMFIVDIADAENQSVAGQFHRYDPNADAWNFEVQTAFYQLTASDLGTFVTLAFEDPIQVSAGDIIAPMAYHDGLDVRIGSAQKVQQGIVFGQQADQSYGSLIDPNAIMVRANMNPLADVENNDDLSTIKVNQYPNPFANETTVNYSLQEASAVEYSVVDMAGNVITSGNEGNQIAGEHSFTIDGASFANGVYFLELTAGDNKVTRRLVVNK